MKIFRKEEIITDLYTKGGELQLFSPKNKSEKPNFYIGPYHTKKGRPYIGATPSTPSTKLRSVIYDRNVFLYNKLQPTFAKAFPGIISIGATINAKDEDAGFFMRFFARQENTQQIFEIDKDLYKRLAKKSNPHHELYTMASIEWKISGPIFNILNKDVIVEHGIIPTNNESMLKAESKMPGISEYLSDSLEYANPREQSSLNSPGDQFQTSTGEEFIGDYHVHMNRPMVGKSHTSDPHEYLYPMSRTVFNSDSLSEEEKIINTDSKTYNSLV
mgnify:FL=1|tara:strand:+ start:15111 stop:15929 length:819 start_codon:yes stop_codon:yes gene_type:complete